MDYVLRERQRQEWKSLAGAGHPYKGYMEWRFLTHPSHMDARRLGDHNVLVGVGVVGEGYPPEVEPPATYIVTLFKGSLSAIYKSL